MVGGFKMQRSYMDAYGKYLAHKGVKGMKWGKVTSGQMKETINNNKDYMFVNENNINSYINESIKTANKDISDIEKQGYPDSYVDRMDARLKKGIRGGRVGFTDEKGQFFEGDKIEKVYKAKFESDLAASRKKTAEEKAHQPIIRRK